MRAIYFLLIIFLGAAAGAVNGQTTVGLVAYYSFNGDFSDATGETFNEGVASGIPEFGCGVDGLGLALNGGNDFIRIPGGNSNNINREFDTEDFTLSLYFKPIGLNGTQYLVSKRDTNCNNLNFFAIRYAPQTQAVSVTLRQNNQLARVDHRIQNGACWQNIVVVRQGNRLTLWLNGEEVGETSTSSRVDITNNGELLIGSTECRNNGEVPFDGLIDEVRIYNRWLRDSEVQNLYVRPDRILTASQRLFLGESIDIELNAPCGITYSWLPTDGVDDTAIAEPTITPTITGRRAYAVRITDAESNCTAVDSVVFQVIDPNTLDCSDVFLPKAFTPNGIGPAANENFGISNPFAIPEMISFEIYDRYGAQMFQTTDVFGKWDGNFKSQAVQPGPFVWRVVYRCEGAELVESGSAIIIR